MKAIILAMSMFLAASVSVAFAQDDKAATPETTTETQTAPQAGEKKACCAKKNDAAKADCPKGKEAKAECANKTEEEKAACAKEKGKKSCPASKKSDNGKGKKKGHNK